MVTPFSCHVWTGAARFACEGRPVFGSDLPAAQEGWTVIPTDLVPSKDGNADTHVYLTVATAPLAEVRVG